MAVQTLTEALDNFYTTTWEKRKSEATDQIFDGTPFWFWMKENDALESVAGGRNLHEPLSYAKSERVMFIGRGGTVRLDENEFLTEAVDEWRYLVDSIVRFGVDDQKNRGKFALMSLANRKIDNSRDSLQDKMEIVLFDTTALSTTQQALAFNSMSDIIRTSASGIVHGIDTSKHTWWDNKRSDMTGLSFAVHGHDKMRTLLNDCGQNKGSDFPNILVSGQTPYEYYESSVIEQKRIVNKKLGDAGFENIEFKGRPMIWSPQCPNTVMYFVNSKYLKFKYDPQVFFDMTEWKPIPNQVNDRAAQIITAGNLMCHRRRCQGVLYGIDTE